MQYVINVSPGSLGFRIVGPFSSRKEAAGWLENREYRMDRRRKKGWKKEWWVWVSPSGDTALIRKFYSPGKNR